MHYLAHTAPKDKPELKAHQYAEHVGEMLSYGLTLFNYLLSFSTLDASEKDKLYKTFKAALMLHDMGKLDESNQRVFRGEEVGHLPVDHIEAGVAVADEMKNELLGWLIRGHHAPGLPNKKTEKYFIKQLRKKFQLKLTNYCLRGSRHIRNKKLTVDWEKHKAAIITTNENIDIYKQRQLSSCGQWPQLCLQLPRSNLTTRLMLSCLVDADHCSAACYSQNIPMTCFKPAKNCWQERLQALDSYISDLVASSDNPESKCNQMRGDFYQRCFGGELFDSRLVACSAPVGLGKTTSVMAYLLRCAVRDESSRIFVIAPFSNIIDQTVKVLRKAVVLDDEDAESIVVAHHHRADFSNKEMRQYTASWKAPIVVTTAVQFFETLAASNPSKLRKLHTVVGAAVFIDESHACLPAELLNVSWHWMKILANNWCCNFIYSSGSMVKFWQDEYLVSDLCSTLPDLLPDRLKTITQQTEVQRVIFDRIEKPLKRDELVERLQSNEIWDEYKKQDKPSCLVILNTVQSAAVIADRLARCLSDKASELSERKVLHLSTALAPKDRDIMLKEVIRRQIEKDWNHKPWYLVATSCVEAGVDLDFAIGYRETCSVTSFLQVSGRINRHGKRKFGQLFDFSIFSEDGLNRHPGFEESIEILKQLWKEMTNNAIDSSELCSKAIRKELSRFPEKKDKSKQLLVEEKKQGFQEVSTDYRIIDSETATVIVDNSLVEKLEKGIPVDWQEIQENSVQLWMNKINKLGLNAIQGCSQDNIYSWTDTHEYDPNFLGIMAGIINPEILFTENGGVC
ncbi:MAG: DEAD/DEAH box helicase [Candidatus Thiodiazotropha sp. (ex Dulcina madagascariensis)]|nr:DEAD/DEAH box helicase [Candidatus Thiodiazotropha sp. (ex Dulcina madagascariensis)]